MQINFFQKVTLYLLIFVELVFLSITTYLINSTHQEFIDFIVKTYNIPHQEHILRSRFITSFRYELLKYIFLSFTLLHPILILLFYVHAEKVYQYLQTLIDAFSVFKDKITQTIQTLSIVEKRLFVVTFSVLSLLRIYLAFAFPLHIDEAFSYIFIVDKGFLATLAYYPGPNNHIGYLLLCSLVKTFSNSPLIIMRLPSLIVSTTFILASFIALKRYFNFFIAFFATFLFSLSQYGLFYSVHGRGYFLLLFFMLLSGYSIFKIVKAKQNSFEGTNEYKKTTKDARTNVYIDKLKLEALVGVPTNNPKFSLSASHLLFIVASTLGFYTIPVFLYPWLSFCFTAFLFIFFGGKAELKKKVRVFGNLVLCMALTTILTLILYTPVFIVSGIQAVVGNAWVKSLNLFWKQLPQYLIELHSAFYSMEKLGVLITIGVLIYLTFNILKNKSEEKVLKREWQNIILLSILVFPLLLICIQKLLPFVRVWLFKFYFEVIALSLLWWRIKKAISQFSTLHQKQKPILNYWFFFPILPFAVWVVFEFQQSFQDPKNIYNQVPLVVEEIAKEQVNQVYVGKDIYNVFLRLAFLEEEKQVLIKTSPIEVQSDDQFDFILLPKNQSFLLKKNPSDYQKILSDDFIDLYKIKSR